MFMLSVHGRKKADFFRRGTKTKGLYPRFDACFMTCHFMIIGFRLPREVKENTAATHTQKSSSAAHGELNQLSHRDKAKIMRSPLLKRFLDLTRTFPASWNSDCYNGG